MADESDKISFLLDLDIKDFTEQGLKAKGIIEKLGGEESLTGLIEGLTSVGAILGTVGLAAFAFKQAIDFTLEAEGIERVNDQFELLAKNAGIAPRELKEGLEQASKGLIDTTDLLKVANEALVKMGGSADKLPEILELARKATQVYGGDAKSNFEAISNAIANGNTRILKHYGIIVDATKAEKDFAAANNTTAETLSAAGKQQAILNAALEQGERAFAGIKENTESATTIMQSLKVTFTDISETFLLAFDKTIGPGIRSFLSSIQKMASEVKLHVTAAIGEGADAAAAKLTITKQKITDIETSLARLNAVKGTAMDFVPGDTQSRITALTKSLGTYQAQLKAIDTQNKQNQVTDDAKTAAAIANSGKATQASIIDIDKQKKQYQEYRKQIDKIDNDYYTQQQKNVNSRAQVEALVAQKRVMLERQSVAQLQLIANNANLTTTQKMRLRAAEEQRHAEEMKANLRDEETLRNKLLDNYVKNSTSAYAGISRSFQANTEKMKKEQADMGKRGNEMWNSLSANATSAFTNMGAQMAQGKDIASSTADAMKGFFLGFLGDRAIAEGTVMMLSGIWPPNPLALGGGAALIALGGALKSVAGAGGAGSSLPSSPSVQATASGSAPPLVDTSPATQTDQSQAVSNMQTMQAAPQRTVQVNIAGNYLETDQTKRMLMDLMRQESDATGFAYNQIGA